MDKEYSLQYSEARNKAIAHIGIDVSSSGKIRDFLLNLGFSSDVIEDVISQLIEDKYVDDRRYARKVLYSRRGPKSEGRSLLQARLLQAGVSEEIACEVLADDEYDDENTIMDVISDRFPVSSFSEDPDACRKQLAKAVRYLEGRGYSTSLALSSFRKWIRDVE